MAPYRTPVGLPAITGDMILCRPSIMLQGLLAHYAAEALLNAPAIVGSLDLLLNPTGLFHSIGQGFEDLISLPLAALEAGSPSQVKPDTRALANALERDACCIKSATLVCNIDMLVNCGCITKSQSIKRLDRHSWHAKYVCLSLDSMKTLSDPCPVQGWLLDY